MKIENEQLIKARANFYKKNRECSGNINTIWKRLVRKVGDVFLTMNDDKEIQRVFDTKITYEEMAKSTKENYFSSYKRILKFLFDEGYNKFDYENWDRQTILGHISRNKDSKTDNIDNSTNKYIAALENLLNSKVQEKEKHNQEIERNNQKAKSLIQEAKSLMQEAKRLNQDSKGHKQKVRDINKECLKITATIDDVNKGKNIIRELPNITRELLSH